MTHEHASVFSSRAGQIARTLRWAALVLVAMLVWVGLAAPEFFPRLLDTSGFPPRWTCGTWTAAHGWLHVGSDIATFLAYSTIPIVLAFFVLRRRDVPFTGLFWLFAAFIFACGTVHLIEAVIFWHPLYRLSGVVKLVTAVVSWTTVVAMIPVIPRALALPGLATVNASLEREVRERERIEQDLRQSVAELEHFHDIAVGREERIIELKRLVNELCARCGEPAAYDLSFAAEALQRRLADRLRGAP